MIKIFGKALVASWRPYESGGSSTMRASQMQCDSVTVFDQVVLAQHPDGFWETFPLGNCSIIWQGKPEVTLVALDGSSSPLTISGNEKTFADTLTQTGTQQKPPPRFTIPPPAAPYRAEDDEPI